MTRSETYAVTKRLYRLLRTQSDKIKFRKLRGACAKYEPASEKITLDPRREILPSLIHEALHHWYPDWCETKVLDQESKIINALSPKQIRNIIRVLGEIL